MRRPRDRRHARTSQRRSRRRLLLGIGLGAIVLALGPAIGVYVTFVNPGREWVVRLDHEAITRATLLDVVRSRQLEAQLSRRTFEPQTAVFDAVSILTDGLVLRAVAPQLEVRATAEDVDEALWMTVMEPSTEPGDPQLNAVFEERYRQYLDYRRLDEGLHRELVEADVLRGLVASELGTDIPPVQRQIHLHSIALADEAAAQAAIDAIAGGTPFDALAVQASIDGNDGDNGWVPYGILPPQAADYLWNLPPGELSQPLLRDDGAFVIYTISERDPERPISDVVRAELEQRLSQEWLADQRDALTIEIRLDSEVFAWVVDQIEGSR